MKNFEWKEDIYKRHDQSDEDQQQPQSSPQIDKITSMAALFNYIYTALDWFEMGFGIVAAFAWLWNTENAPFATFLLIAVYVVEKVVDLIDGSMDWTIQDSENSDDDGEHNGEDDE